MTKSQRYLLNRFDTERIAFRLTASYRRIELLEKQETKKYFTLMEQKEFLSEINRVFKDTTREIRVLCPTLTDEDLILCYLVVEWNLSNAIICFCFGNGDSAPVKQRKYRIKEKMKEVQSEEIFDYIFNNKCLG